MTKTLAMQPPDGLESRLRRVAELVEECGAY
jgi:hypothetical protein